jgi:hypothetical protein
MTIENTANPTDTAETAEGKRGPRKVRLRDEVLADLREDAAKIAEKIAKIEAEIAAEEQLATLVPGDVISFVTGRAENRRVESGTVLASGTTDKGQFQINVMVGEGLTSTTKLVGGSAVVPPGMTGDEFLATFPKVEPKAETSAE